MRLLSLFLLTLTLGYGQALNHVSTLASEVTTVTKTSKSEAELKTTLTPILESAFDIDRITRSSFGPIWRTLTPPEQEMALKHFKKIVLSTYLSRLKPASTLVITFGKETVLQGNTIIPSKLTYEGQTVQVEYRLRQQDTSWKITDVNIEGVSLVANYRAQFIGLYGNGGPKGIQNLLSALETKANTL